MAASIETLREWFSKHAYNGAWTGDRSNGLDAVTAVVRMLKQLHTCPAETESEFKKWAEEWMAEERSDAKWRAEYAKLSLDELIAVAPKKRANTKQMEVETHGDRTFIKLEHKHRIYPWTIPTTWLPIAQALWPCFIKFNRYGPYVAMKSKRQRLNSKWFQIDIPVHQIYLNANARERILARDGSFLNYLVGNLAIEDDGMEREVTDPDHADKVMLRGGKGASIPVIDDVDTYDETFAKAKAAKPTMKHQEEGVNGDKGSMAALRRDVAMVSRAWNIRQRGGYSA